MRNRICFLVWPDKEERTLEEKVENVCLKKKKKKEQITNETAEIHAQGKGSILHF